MTDTSAPDEPAASGLQTGLDTVVTDWLVALPEPVPGILVSYEVRTSAGVLAARSATDEHYAASTMKLPLVLAAYRRRDAGTLDLDSTVKVHNSFTSQAGGSYGIDRSEDSDEEVWAAMDQSVTLRWLCRRSIIRSSNLATNLVLERVGLAAVAEAIADCRADGVTVARGIGDYAAQALGTGNRVTVAGLNQLLVALSQQTAAAPATCEEMLDILAANEIDTDVRGGLPAGTWVAHKNGWISEAVLDAALVRPDGRNDSQHEFVLSAAVSGRLPNQLAHSLIQALATTVWDHRAEGGEDQ